MKKNIFKRLLAMALVIMMILGLLPSNVFAGTYVSLDQSKYYTDDTVISGTMPTSSSWASYYPGEVEVAYTTTSGAVSVNPPFNGSSAWSYPVSGLKAGTTVGVYFNPHMEVDYEIKAWNYTTGNDDVNNGDTVLIQVCLTNISDYSTSVKSGATIHIEGGTYSSLTLIPNMGTTPYPVTVDGSEASNYNISWGSGTEGTVTFNSHYYLYKPDSQTYPTVTFVIIATYAGSATTASALANDNDVWVEYDWEGVEEIETAIVYPVIEYDSNYIEDSATESKTLDKRDDSTAVRVTSSTYKFDHTTLTYADTGFPVREGYTFEGWNTAPDGTGTTYGAGDTATITDDVTLYAQWKANEYTVTYYANGGSGSYIENVTYGETYIVKSSSDTGISREGYSFTGWNTQEDGKGTPYAVSGGITIEKNVTLYAQWETNAYTVTYKANGGTGSDYKDNVRYNDSYSIISSDTAGISRDGYTFKGWNTQADGLGDNYSAGNTFTIKGNVILYATWEANAHTVTYKANGGEGSDYIDNVKYDQSYTIKSDSDTSFIYTNHTFIGWNTQADGNGQNYASGGNLPIKGDTILYAQWKENDKYMVIYNANGGIGRYEDSGFYENHNYTVKNTDTTGITYEGYTFIEWNTKTDGSGQSYLGSSGNTSFTMPGNHVYLYAQWKANDHKVTYNANGGTGSHEDNVKYDENYSVKDIGDTGISRDGYTFKGWYTEADASGTSYAADAVISITGDVTLYASWEANAHTVIYLPNGGTGTFYLDNVKYNESYSVKDLSDTGISRDGYTFKGWDTRADGTGEAYTAGNTITIAGNVILYAKWEAIEYHITYDENLPDGATLINSSSPPSDNKSYQVGSMVTVLNDNGMECEDSRGGILTFMGWSTNKDEDDEGNLYKADDTFNITEDTTLYAIWGATVTYYGNGNTSGIVPSAETVIIGASVTLAGQGSLEKSGHSFVGWKSQGSGITRYGNQTYEMPAYNVYLDAVWNNETLYSVIYYSNRPVSSDMSEFFLDEGYYDTESITIKDAEAATNAYDSNGYIFVGWSTNKNSAQGDSQYAPDMTYSFANGNLELYAIWAYEVTYDSNVSATEQLISGNVPTDVNSPYESGSTVNVIDSSSEELKKQSTVPDENGRYPVYVLTGWAFTDQGVNSYLSLEDSLSIGEYYFTDGGTVKRTKTDSGFTNSNDSAFTIENPVTLYAVWERVYTVTYDGNQNTDGTVPADNNEYRGDSVATVLDNTEKLVKTGYTFNGWNTKADGTGLNYNAGSTITIEGDVTLYAMWEAIEYTITYDANAPTGKTAAGSTTDNSTYHYGDLTTIEANGFIVDDYVFKGWNTKADGTGTGYAEGGDVTITKDITLYAQWHSSHNPYLVIYNANGGSGSYVEDGIIDGATYTVLDLVTTGISSPEGYTFVGWNTKADGSGQSYPGENGELNFIMPAEDVTLYAMWEANTYTVTYNANGGIGSYEDNVKYNDVYTVKSDTDTNISYTGHKFIGWNTEADGKGIDYKAGAELKITEDITLYAQWEEEGQEITTTTTSKSNTPKTGDESNLILPIILLISSIGVGAFALWKRKRKTVK